MTMPSDAHWEAIRDTTSILCWDHTTYDPEAASTLWSRPRDYVHKPTFYPGDIAYASGGITGAYLDCLERLGVHFNKEERELRESVNKTQGRQGKYCVVLERVDVDTYWVCYLSRFAGDSRTGRISFPAGLFFGLAFGEAQPFPPGFSPLHTSPPWNEQCYLFAAPVLRRGLQISNKRFIFGKRSRNNRSRKTSMQAGELERIKHEVQTRMEQLKGDPSILWKLRREMVESDAKLRKVGGVSAVEYLDEETLMKPPTISSRPGDNLESSLDAEAALDGELESSLGTDEVDMYPQFSPDTVRPVLRPLHVPTEGNHITWLSLWNRADLEESYSSLSLKPAIRAETDGQRLWRVYNERVVTTMSTAAVERLTRRRYEPPYGRSLLLDIARARSEQQFKRRMRSTGDPEQAMAALKRLGLCPDWFTPSSIDSISRIPELQPPPPASPEVVEEDVDSLKEDDDLARSGTVSIHSSRVPEEPISTSIMPSGRLHDPALSSRSLPISTGEQSDGPLTRELARDDPPSYVVGEGPHARSPADTVHRPPTRDLLKPTGSGSSPLHHDPPARISMAPSPFRHPVKPTARLPSNDTTSSRVEQRPRPPPDSQAHRETPIAPSRLKKGPDRPPPPESRLPGETTIASSSITDANNRLSAAEEAMRLALNMRGTARDALESARQALVESEKQVEDARALLVEAEAASRGTQYDLGSRSVHQHGSWRGHDVGLSQRSARHSPAVSAAAYRAPTWALPSQPSPTRQLPVSRPFQRNAHTRQEVGEHPSAAFRHSDGWKSAFRNGGSQTASKDPSPPSHGALAPDADDPASYLPPSLSALQSRGNARDATWSYTGNLRLHANKQVPDIPGTRKLHSLVSRIVRFVPPSRR